MADLAQRQAGDVGDLVQAETHHIVQVNDARYVRRFPVQLR
jgi:hypothetical protein